MGMLPDRLPGYGPVADDQARSALDALWKTKIPSEPGLGSRSLLTHRGQGKVKALWLSRYDPTNTALLGDVAGTTPATRLAGRPAHLHDRMRQTMPTWSCRRLRLAKKKSPSPAPTDAFNWRNMWSIRPRD